MRFRNVSAAALVAAASLFAAGAARAEVSVHVDISNTPPPPHVVFSEAPPCDYYPESRMYIVNRPDIDYDCFHYGPYWYISAGDYWYRARSYHGPFTVIH